MGVPRLFWFSLSLTLLIIAGSVSYFVLVYIPRRDANRDRVAAESVIRDAERRTDLGCANQAEQASNRLMREMRSDFGPNADHVVGLGNHYNRRLRKCLVEIQTLTPEGGGGFIILDAYENWSLLSCTTLLRPKETWQRFCLNPDGNLDPEKADVQEKALTSE
jgi:hypothetical protein